MQSDDPAYLTVGTEVSAKFKGAFCEAKVKKVTKSIKIKVLLKEAPFGSIVVDDLAIPKTAKIELNELVDVTQGKQTFRAVIQHIKDCSKYHVVFNDGDEKELRRTQLCLKGGKHFDAAGNLDALPLYNPEQFSNPVVRNLVGKAKLKQKRKGDESSPSRRKKRKDEDDDEESDEDGGRRREKRAAASAASVAIGEMNQGVETQSEESSADSSEEKEREKERKRKRDEEKEKEREEMEKEKLKKQQEEKKAKEKAKLEKISKHISSIANAKERLDKT
ncbi:unnamed protein product [Caenorhabditis bovis]|uniref:Tudor domain-containing protein n=1 Tax=Caenorhabditis bovis TaxID=2654633 RepID=A0A8S1EDN6_9PELO|nr:unnamed protein product [Caenorhabditis bovis]